MAGDYDMVNRLLLGWSQSGARRGLEWPPDLHELFRVERSRNPTSLIRLIVASMFAKVSIFAKVSMFARVSMFAKLSMTLQASSLEASDIPR